MTMRFRIVKAALVELLGDAAAGRFTVVGYQSKGQAAEEVTDSRRTVQVFYTSGEFPPSGGSISGPVKHGLTFRIDLTVGSASKGDLTAINDPTSTPAQVAAAMEGFQTSAALADKSFDDLFEIVYQIVMDARNIDIGLDPGEVSSRWIGSVEKSEPFARGEYIVIGGMLEFTCIVSEDLVGDEGLPADQVDGAVLVDIETHTPPDTEEADPAPAGVRGGD